MHKNYISVVLFSFIMLCISSASFATSLAIVTDGYVRETIPGTTISSAYFTITNSSDTNISLVKITSDVSDKIELHEHVMENDMMKMREVTKVEIAAQSNVEFKPYGFHVMIFDLIEPLKAETTAQFTFHFDNNQQLQIVLPVKSVVERKVHHH